MNKRWLLTGPFLVLFTLMSLTTAVIAFTVLTEEEALREVFPKGVEIENETKILSGETLKNIRGKLGGSLVYLQEGSESAAVREEKKIVFHFAKQEGKRIGVAIVDEQPGKWGPVTFITAMNIQGTVKAVRVLSYEEIRGRPIAQLSFMNQYRGKDVNSPLTVGKDIAGISGATISSRSATFAVKKALVIYNEVYKEKH